MRVDAVARVAISSVAVASGTVAFVALATGNRRTAIGFALVGGTLGLASAFGQALERENGLLRPEAPPAVVREDTALAGVTRGRLMGR